MNRGGGEGLLKRASKNTLSLSSFYLFPSLSDWHEHSMMQENEKQAEDSICCVTGLNKAGPLSGQRLQLVISLISYSSLADAVLLSEITL